jgi:formylglycine-generating enzyme required for sulfatase activity
MRLSLALFCAGCFSQGLQAPDPKMISVEGGTFTMGSNNSCNDPDGILCGGDHWPHDVTVSSFSIGNREITRGQWAVCQHANICPSADNIDTRNYRVDRPDDPVLLNNIDQAMIFCNWKGGRLPSEAEFELVQRGGDVKNLHLFPWGDDLNVSNTDVTPSGIHDLAGGVPEWVLDGYNPNIGCPDRLSSDDVCTGSATCCMGDMGFICAPVCLPAVTTEPMGENGTLACAPGSVGPDFNPVFTGFNKVVRGGSDLERPCFRAGYTRRYAPNAGTFSAGFRCVIPSAELTTPVTLRFRLNSCPSGATVDLNSQKDFVVDSFDGNSGNTVTSTAGAATGLPCTNTFVLRNPMASITITSTVNMCTNTWQLIPGFPDGDSALVTLNPISSGLCSTQTTCPGANLMTDPNNCGRCGNVCGTGTCNNGVCPCGDTTSDSANCGACGHSCFGTACVNSLCQPGAVATAQPSPFAVVADAGSGALYFSNRADGTGSVFACQLDLVTGTYMCSSIANNLSSPGMLALDSSNVYWGNSTGNTVDACARGGCSFSPQVLDPMATSPLAITIEGNSLLYTVTGEIRECPLPDCIGGNTSLGMGLLFNPTFGLAADATTLYFGSGQLLMSCPRTGCSGSPNIVSSAMGNIGPLRLDSGTLYFADSRAVQSWDGKTVTSLFMTSSPAFALASDSTNLYWTQPLDGTIWYCHKSSCAATARAIATNQSLPLGITVAGPGLFWANSRGGQVMGMAIPAN